ncbi:MAG TPA: outer membrane beta-barrel protein [Chitinophagaceae bacterium]|jgi:hypothetical protein|nr:outer membrane beta-barrel protein [Chitinophagaceae bacterium]
MKKNLIIVNRFIIPTLLLLFISIVFQSPMAAQQQTKKGRWFIKHNAGSLEYISSDYRIFDGAGVLANQQKEHGLNFRTSFSATDYGDVYYYNTTYETPGVPSTKNRGFRITLEPVGGIFIKDNLLVGASLRIGMSRYRFLYDKTDQRIRSTTLGLGPFVRYYFRGTEKARFFGGLESRYTFSKDRNPTTTISGGDRYESNDNTDETEFMVQPHVGYAWFVGKRWSFELQSYYQYRRRHSDNIRRSSKNGMMQAGYPVISEEKFKAMAIGLSAGIGFSI